MSFQQSLFIDEIEIYETYNPGAVVTIFAFNYSNTRWIKIWSIFDEGTFKSNNEAINRILPSKCSVKFCPKLRRKDNKTEYRIVLKYFKAF